MSKAKPLVYEPLDDRAIIEEDTDMTSLGGVILPEHRNKQQLQGTVIAKGGGKVLETGHVKVYDIEPGDKVIFFKQNTQEVSLNGKDYRMIRLDDILLKVS